MQRNDFETDFEYGWTPFLGGSVKAAGDNLLNP
jgi:hypothetical protein